MSKGNGNEVVKKNMAATCWYPAHIPRNVYFRRSGLSSGAELDGRNTHFQ